MPFVPGRAPCRKGQSLCIGYTGGSSSRGLVLPDMHSFHVVHTSWVVYCQCFSNLIGDLLVPTTLVHGPLVVLYLQVDHGMLCDNSFFFLKSL